MNLKFQLYRCVDKDDFEELFQLASNLMGRYPMPWNTPETVTFFMLVFKAWFKAENNLLTNELSSFVEEGEITVIWNSFMLGKDVFREIFVAWDAARKLKTVWTKTAKYFMEDNDHIFEGIDVVLNRMADRIGPKLLGIKLWRIGK